MPAHFSWTGYDALQRKLARLAKPDASDLMQVWEKIIVEDNRRGVLAGLDKNDRPAPPLRYRNGKGSPPSRRSRGNSGTVVGANNPGEEGGLTSSQYRRLTGPRLAPRREFSRVITNLHTMSGPYPGVRNRWFAMGGWDQVLSRRTKKGKPGIEFLPFHFEGKGNNPRYDLTGVRPWGMRQARLALRQWIDRLLKG